MARCSDCRNKDHEIARLNRTIVTKMQTIERLKANTAEGHRLVAAAYPNFDRFYDQLVRAHWMADPVKASAPSPTRKSQDVPEEGRDTRRDRATVRHINRVLGRLAYEWSQGLGAERQRVPLRDESPRCRRRDCRLRGRRQAIDALSCRSCDRPFADVREEA